MSSHNETGKRGEAIATEYLKKKDYMILEKNWRYEKAEIDIIAVDKDELVIVEVKTLSTARYGFPEESINTAKQNNLSKAADAYIEEKSIDMGVRFDILSIILQGKKPQIQHSKDTFFPKDFIS